MKPRRRATATGPRLVDRSRGARRARHTRDEVVLPERQPLRRRAEHAHRPRDAGPARRAAGAQPARGRAGDAHWLALNCQIRPCTFHRKNYFYPDMPKAYQISHTTSRSTSTAGSTCRRHAHRHRAGAPRGGHGKSTHSAAPAGDPRQRRLTDRLQPRRRAAGRDRQPARRAHSEQAGSTSTSCGRSSSPSAPPTPSGEGSMRVDANVSVHRPASRSAPAARSRTSTRSVRSVAPRYEARRQIGLLDRASRSARRRGTGTRETAARTRCGRRRTPTTTGTSSSPTSCRSCPTRRGSARVPGSRCCRRPAGALAAATGAARRLEA